MIDRPDFKLTISQNGKDTGIDTDYFLSLKITENLNYNFYFAELALKQNIFWDILFTTRENIDISLSHRKMEYESMQTQESLETDEYVEKNYKFVVFDYQMAVDTIIITLVPWFFPALYVEKVTTGYNEKIEEVVKDICGKIGIKSIETDSTSASKRLMLQLGQSNLGFLKSIIDYASGYVFFVNKKDKAYFVKYDKLIGDKKAVLGIHNTAMGDVYLENNVYALESMGGLGGTSYYFDWDGGTMKSYNNEKKQLGMYTSDVNLKSNIIMGNPTSTQQDFYASENYNFNQIDNAILFKNLFKIFVHFNTYGIYDVNLGDKVELYFQKKTSDEKHEWLSGDYFVYGTTIVLDNRMQTHFVCSTPFFFKTVKNFSGKNI